MKKRQFRYILSFLILILFVFAALVDSQESTEQIIEESTPTEQSSTDQLSEEPNPIEQSAEGSNPSESQFNTLKDDFEMLQHSFSALKDSSDNRFRIFIIITIAFIILISAFVIFWGRRLLSSSEQHLEGKLDKNRQSLDSRLNRMRQQGNERSEKIEEMESNQSSISNELEKFQNTVASVESELKELVQTVEDLESAREMDITPDNTVVYQVDVESTVLETQKRVEELALAYKGGEPINLHYIETSIPSYNVVLNINWIAQAITEWIAKLEQSTTVNQDLIQTLKYAEQTIKGKLKTIREESMPSLKPLNLETDAELGDIRDQSITYLAHREGVLIGYELGRKVNEATDAQFIPQFIRNDLFNNVAKYIPHDQLQEQLDRFLQLTDYEVIPVEVGVTEADSRFHEIQGSEQTSVRRGTVAEVISPGLMQKTDRTIVQKPVVIRGE
ncbi:MAG: hypothetical protein OXC79_08295 [Candidatus Poribacteria bacterium]|nr:hypothetical protein [Candidatus Poribacteria bacterium]